MFRNLDHWKVRNFFLAASLLTGLTSCDHKVDSVRDFSDMEKVTYSLCPMSGEAPSKLYQAMKSIAEPSDTRFIDRSADAVAELKAIDSTVADTTSDEPLLLTVEKAGDFRISVTNFGLEEKYALSIRGGDEARMRLQEIIHRRLQDHWEIVEADENVTNDPSCS